MSNLNKWLELYQSPKLHLRIRAADGLLNLGETLPLDILLNILDRTEELGLGAKTEKILKQRRDPELMDEMIKRLTSPQDGLREIACTVLGELHNCAATPHLLARLDDPNWWVRRKAGFALAELKDPSSVEGILRRYQKYPKENINVRMALECALDELEVNYSRHPFP